MWKKTTTAAKDQFGYVHRRMMKKNCKAVPQWWFYTILILTVILSIYSLESFDKQIQLPWWGLFACFMAFFFTLPVGIIQATTNLVCFHDRAQIRSLRMCCFCAATRTEVSFDFSSED
ncbi:hypothetical protein Ddye_027902 [Dipteronia dyeriana]|uniref:Uncharacterized protein n=1 Tax=Dipteronia dyeriana TaxID=168575 RepID=A0AAD9TQG4_9ROSI|nr:hypothetical protein Ddye_027902 [Dipteronia dyeriana]